MNLNGYKQTIVSIIEANGFKRIPKQKKPEKAPTTFSNRSFQLTFKGLYNPTTYIGQDVIWSNNFELELTFVSSTETEIDSAHNDFIMIISALSNDPNFHGFIGEDIPFLPIDVENYKYKGTIKFLFGLGISA